MIWSFGSSQAVECQNVTEYVGIKAYGVAL